ncbi:MAG: hypothetical protein NVS4B3_19780 [Gemmatimonadaceae bacterium]
MRKSIVVAVLLMVPVLVRAQSPSQRSALGNASRIEQEIRRANTEEVRALLAADVHELSRLWSDEFVVTNPLNKFVTKQEVLGMVKSDTLAFSSYDRQVEYVHVYRNAVVAAGSETVVWAGKLPIAGKTSSLRFTAVWVKEGGRWQEVARHANIVPELHSR